MYVAVKGGEAAIENAHRLLDLKRRGAAEVPPLSLAQISQQMPLAVARVMSEGSLYDRELAALAIKQSAGDLLEAIFLLRAYRTTLSRYCVSRPLHTESMQMERRISATYKDLPGGQLLGPTFDYTHRLLDFTLQAEGEQPQDLQRGDAQQTQAAVDGAAAAQHAALAGATQLAAPAQEELADGPDFPRVLGLLAQEGLMREETDSAAPIPDITREPLDFPSNRMQRLQALARGDEGFLLALGYSTQRGYGRNHPFAGEIRIGFTEVWLEPEELDFAVPAGDIEVTECEMVNQFVGSKDQPAQFTRGYGLAFGYNERKVMGMALVDRALRAAEYDEEITSPAQQEEFVLMHCDNVEAAGFVSHLKLPHYVDFQAELELIRKMRKRDAQAEINQEQQQQTEAGQVSPQKEKRA
jgi:alpha-D-ribose 1-methylphosphonate 5-triphosphate synthase subunit PhnI